MKIKRTKQINNLNTLLKIWIQKRRHNILNLKRNGFNKF